MRYWRTGWRRPAAQVMSTQMADGYTPPSASLDPAASVEPWRLAEVEAERDAVAKSAVELAELLREARRRHGLLERERDAAVADRDMARRVNVKLREELAKPAGAEALEWKLMWERDRANLVKLEQRLAVLEGREQHAAVAS